MVSVNRLVHGVPKMLAYLKNINIQGFRLLAARGRKDKGRVLAAPSSPPAPRPWPWWEQHLHYLLSYSLLPFLQLHLPSSQPPPPPPSSFNNSPPHPLSSSADLRLPLPSPLAQAAASCPELRPRMPPRLPPKPWRPWRRC